MGASNASKERARDQEYDPGAIPQFGRDCRNMSEAINKFFDTNLIEKDVLKIIDPDFLILPKSVDYEYIASSFGHIGNEVVELLKARAWTDDSDHGFIAFLVGHRTKRLSSVRE